VCSEARNVLRWESAPLAPSISLSRSFSSPPQHHLARALLAHPPVESTRYENLVSRSSPVLLLRHHHHRHQQYGLLRIEATNDALRCGQDAAIPDGCHHDRQPPRPPAQQGRRRQEGAAAPPSGHQGRRRAQPISAVLHRRVRAPH